MNVAVSSIKGDISEYLMISPESRPDTPLSVVFDLKFAAPAGNLQTQTMLRVDLRSGQFVLQEAEAEHCVYVKFEGPLTSHGMLIDEEGRFRVIVVGGLDKTQYIVVRDETIFMFHLEKTVRSLREAMVELMIHNLGNSAIPYKRTARTINQFFTKAFRAVLKENMVFQAGLVNWSQTQMKCRVYLNAKDPADSMISINGFVYGWNPDDYPTDQVSKECRRVKRHHRCKPRTQHVTVS